LPVGLQRLYGYGHLHFITFSCYRRLPLLKSAQARDAFVRELARLRECIGFRLIGYVVMPEHVHLLLNEPPCGTPSTVLHDLKLRTGRRLRKPGLFEESREPLRAFWQARFYDFNVFTEKKKRGETRVHAPQPSEPRTSVTSTALAVKQLVELRKGRRRVDSGGSVVERKEGTPRPRFKNRTWGTQLRALRVRSG
jgi:REP-associated tyrosine transposase